MKIITIAGVAIAIGVAFGQAIGGGVHAPDAGAAAITAPGPAPFAVGDLLRV